MIKPLGRVTVFLTVLVSISGVAGAGSAWAQGTSGGRNAPAGRRAAVARAATAGADKIAVGTIGPAGLAADLRVKLEEAVASGLSASGANVVTAVTLSRTRGAAGLGACTDAVCERRLVQITDARYWVRGNCQLDTSTYRLHLELLDVASGALIAARDDTCDICTEADAADLASVAASTLKAKLAEAKAAGGAGPATASAAPEAAAGTSVGGGDAATPVAEGEGAAAEDASGERPMWMKVVPWVAFAGAAAAIGVGIYYVAIDGREVGCGQMDVTCPKANDTLVSRGLPYLGAGALLAAAGIIVLTLSSPTAPAVAQVAGAPTAPQPSHTGIAVSLTSVSLVGRF